MAKEYVVCSGISLETSISLKTSITWTRSRKRTYVYGHVSSFQAHSHEYEDSDTSEVFLFRSRIASDAKNLKLGPFPTMLRLWQSKPRTKTLQVGVVKVNSLSI